MMQEEPCLEPAAESKNYLCSKSFTVLGI